MASFLWTKQVCILRYLFIEMLITKPFSSFALEFIIVLHKRESIMSMKNWEIEVSQDMYVALKEVFGSLGLDAPSKITPDAIHQAIHGIENIQEHRTKIQKLNALNKAIKPQETKKQTAIVISSLGIIRYQLLSDLTSMNIDTVTYNNAYNGLIEYFKKIPDLVIIDIADNYDDITDLVVEMKRVSKKYDYENKICIISLPTTEDVKDRYRQSGADIFIEKTDNWEQSLYAFIETKDIPQEESAPTEQKDLNREKLKQKLFNTNVTPFRQRKEAKILSFPAKPASRA